MRKVCVVVGSRANYSSIKSVMRAVDGHPDLQLQVVAGAAALLDRYGAVVKHIERDGFQVAARMHMLVEGETPATMVQSTGLGLVELPLVFDQLRPDIVVTVGDRFETMATAVAAAYMNITLAHTMGGEISGTIDESIRHAVTKFAHVHFPACEQARARIVRLGERPEHVHLVGCPRIDLVAEILQDPAPLKDDLFGTGVGGRFDIDGEFLLVSQHPVTTEYGSGREQILATLRAVEQVGLPAIILWPNADAGSEDIAAGMRWFREHRDESRLHFFKNLQTDVYVRLMARATCLVGNSSSGIREGAFIGTPTVNIGTRQMNRQRGPNVVDVDYNVGAIADAVGTQRRHGRYDRTPIYGDGGAGPRIADILAVTSPPLQKVLTF